MELYRQINNQTYIKSFKITFSSPALINVYEYADEAICISMYEFCIAEADAGEDIYICSDNTYCC